MSEPVKHCMVDLETLSTEPNARILSIGAVMFSLEEGIFDVFYRAVITPLPDELMATFDKLTDFHVSKSTLDWWREQSPEAQKVFYDPEAVSITEALEAFALWAKLHAPPKELRVWGNGSDFDNVILASAYSTMKLPRPWMFYNNRCYRTVKKMYPSVELIRTGTHHNALADAESQAAHLLRMGCYLG